MRAQPVNNTRLPVERRACSIIPGRILNDIKHFCCARGASRCPDRECRTLTGEAERAKLVEENLRTVLCAGDIVFGTIHTHTHISKHLRIVPRVHRSVQPHTRTHGHTTTPGIELIHRALGDRTCLPIHDLQRERTEVPLQRLEVPRRASINWLAAWRRDMEMLAVLIEERMSSTLSVRHYVLRCVDARGMQVERARKTLDNCPCPCGSGWSRVALGWALARAQVHLGRCIRIPRRRWCRQPLLDKLVMASLLEAGTVAWTSACSPTRQMSRSRAAGSRQEAVRGVVPTTLRVWAMVVPMSPLLQRCRRFAHGYARGARHMIVWTPWTRAQRDLSCC